MPSDIQKEMVAFMLKDAVITGSPAILCARRYRVEAIKEKAEVIFYFVNITNMPYVVGIFFQHCQSSLWHEPEIWPGSHPETPRLVKSFGSLAKLLCSEVSRALLLHQAEARCFICAGTLISLTHTAC